MTAKLVAVLGATGTTGKSVITALLSSDKHIRIRAPVRNLVKAQQLFPENVEFTVVADFGDVKAVAEALKDVDALYAMVPPSPDKQIRLDATTAEVLGIACSCIQGFRLSTFTFTYFTGCISCRSKACGLSFWCRRNAR